MHDAPLPASHARGVQLASVTTDLLGAQAQGGQEGHPNAPPARAPAASDALTRRAGRASRGVLRDERRPPLKRRAPTDPPEEPDVPVMSILASIDPSW